MHAYRFIITIPEDRRVILPDDIPPGPAEIHVIVEAARGPNESFMALVDELAKAPGPTRAKEDIDAELVSERASWE